MIETNLTPDEIHMASVHGVWRQMQAIQKNRVDRNKDGKFVWDRALEGACAELAYCKWRGCYWSGVEKIKARDAGFVEIRWTGHEAGGLIVNPWEEDDARFVLMYGKRGKYQIVGWFTGKEAKDQKYWVAAKEYFLVPAQFIREMK